MYSSRPRYPPLRFDTPIHGLYENQPPRPWEKADSLPKLVDLTTFRRIHRQRDDQLKRYLQSGRPDWESMPRSVWVDLLRANADCLAACNAEARINVAQIACQALLDRGIAERSPLFFVTFAPAAFVYPIATAHLFDVRRITAMLRQALRDVPLFGFVEAALYLGWGPHGPAPFHSFVSWHAHFITWTASRTLVAERLQPLQDRHCNMVGRSPVWVLRMRPDQIEQKLVYMAKGQLKEYRIGATPGEEVDEATGVIISNTRQQKRWMRTGQHVQMCNVMRDHRIDGLLLGNGKQGTWLAEKVRYEARRPFCDWAHHQNSAATLAGREEPYPIVNFNRALGLRLRRELFNCF